MHFPTKGRIGYKYSSSTLEQNLEVPVNTSPFGDSRIVKSVRGINGARNNTVVWGKQEHISNIMAMYPAIVEHILYHKVPGLLQLQLKTVCDAAKVV